MTDQDQSRYTHDEGTALSIYNVTVSYGHKQVVSDVSFSLPKGVTFGLIGLNGAGKTTLIKTILGLRRQDGGDIFLFGENVNRIESKKSLVYLPERFDPPWFLTGKEFLHFSASLYGIKLSEKEITDKAAALALEPDVLGNRVQTYSKGMRQKLGLMATLLSACPFMILDEPMSGLDPQARACVKAELQQAKEGGTTIFLSSHILSDMDEICDGVAVLHGGTILYNGTPGDLKKEQKATRMEQAFLNVVGLGNAKAA